MMSDVSDEAELPRTDAEFPRPDADDDGVPSDAWSSGAEPPAASDEVAAGSATALPTGATRWYRSDERVIAGVAGGLAESTALDPVLVRLGFVGLTMFNAFGILAYLSAWLMMPACRGAPLRSRWRRAVGLAVLAFGAISLAVQLWGGDPGSFAFIAAIVGVAAALWHPHRRNQATPTRPPADLGGWGPPHPTEAGTERSRPIVVLPERTPRPPRPARPRSPLGRVTLAAALAAVAVGASAGHATPHAMRVALTVAGLVCGVGLLIGTIIGRARWLVIPGLLAAGGAMIAQAVDGLGVRFGIPIVGEVGGTEFIEQASRLHDVNIGAGSYNFQIAKLDKDGSLTAKVGAGGLTVAVSPDTRVSLRARVGLGSIDTPESSVDGYRRVVTQTFGPEGGRHLDLDLTAGIGRINVYTVTFADVRPVDPNPVPIGPADPVVPITPTPLPPGASGTDETGAVYYDYPGGQAVVSATSIWLSDGTTITADGSRVYGTGARILPDGSAILIDGTLIDVAGSVHLPNGAVIPSLAGSASSDSEASPNAEVTVVPTIVVSPTSVPAPVGDGTTVTVAGTAP